MHSRRVAGRKERDGEKEREHERERVGGGGEGGREREREKRKQMKEGEDACVKTSSGCGSKCTHEYTHGSTSYVHSYRVHVYVRHASPHICTALNPKP